MLPNEPTFSHRALDGQECQMYFEGDLLGGPEMAEQESKVEGDDTEVRLVTEDGDVGRRIIGIPRGLWRIS